ncbi:hypothetical protein QPM17_06540 [Marinobacter sp. TBZ242]|uniref:Bacterial virulence factor lipase N-terminal domain-containing protein n=1 Tax=Marinobacter azerbaijanicus TaxID=3050455 RepID=A0ABT7I9E1_9GAMM|nr:hypothetical protein [Marinobacter sp. TBZ242]MDL0430772.1 hypothetical protein [Marinobacter sp. TBZ242]
MFTRQASLLTLAFAAVGLTGCLDSSSQTTKNANPEYTITNPGLERGTHPLFDPLKTEFPIPSDSLFFLSETDDGTMLNGSDPANPVTTGIGFLDGNSVLAPIDIKISASIDSQQTLDARDFIAVEGEVIPNPDQNVFLIPLEYASGDSLRQAAGEVAGITPANRYRRALALEESGNTAEADAIFESLLEEKFRVELLDIDGGQNNMIRVLPLQPLASKTRYALAVTNDIVDSAGEPLVGAPTYQSVADPDVILANVAFEPFREALLPARRLVSDYFDFKRETDAAAGFSASFDDVVFSTTITTTAVDDILLANAAPVTFFRSSLRIQARQQGLDQLTGGFYNLTQQPLGESATPEQQSINDEIFTILTDTGFRLYDAELAELLNDAKAGGVAVGYGDIVDDSQADRRVAFALQVATALAVDNVTDQETEAQALATAAEDVLDTPKPRTVRIFNQRDGGDVNPALAQEVAGTPLNIHVYEGEISLPYYQGIPEEGDGSAIQSANWTAADFSGNESLNAAPSERITYRFPFAAKTGETKVPVVVAAPDTNQTLFAGRGPYPVIIYQHALTTDRSAILPLATAAGLSCADPGNSFDCFVTIGIDQPLHGIFDEGIVGLNPITTQAGASADATERHFGFAANDAMSAVPAPELESPESGGLFLNFTNYANTLDNMRQGTLDLLNVNASLQAIEDAIDACQAAGDCAQSLNIDPSRVYFLSHSLSGMGGAAFPPVNNAAVEAGNSNLNSVQASNLLNTGGQFTRLFENSQSLAPQLLPGLDAASDGLLAQGRTELNIYFNVFQGLLDSADPVAYAGFYRDTNTLLTEIAGVEGDPDRPTDDTIPNSADALLYPIGPLETTVPETGFVISSENAPLAGTDPMAAGMGAMSTPLATGLPAITRYLEGSHGNPISAGQKSADAFSSRAVFDEMIAQMLELFTDGTVSVTNPCVVKDADTSGTDCSAEGNTDAGDEPDSGGDDGSGDGDGGLLDGGLL